MIIALRVLSRALGAVAIVAVVVAWVASDPEISRGDAVEIALGALGAAGTQASVDEQAVADTYRPEPSSDDPSPETIPVWHVEAQVRGSTVGLAVHTEVGSVVFLDDLVEPDRDAYLFSDDEAASIATYRNDVALDRLRFRNLMASVAGLLLAVVAWMLPTVWVEREVASEPTTDTGPVGSPAGSAVATS